MHRHQTLNVRLSDEHSRAHFLCRFQSSVDGEKCYVRLEIPQPRHLFFERFFCQPFIFFDVAEPMPPIEIAGVKYSAPVIELYQIRHAHIRRIVRPNVQMLVVPFGVTLHIDNVVLRKHLDPLGPTQIVAENVACRLMRVGSNARAEVVEMSVRHQDVQPIELPVADRSIDRPRRILVIIEQQKRPPRADHKAAVQQVRQFH